MSISDNIKHLHENIADLKVKLGVSYDIRIVAVTKTRSPEEVLEVLKAGLTEIGENRVQEAEQKFAVLGEQLNATRRLIGNLQENKVNKALRLFDTLDSLDSLKLAAKLNRKCMESERILPVLVEINTSAEINKHGLSPEAGEDFLGAIREMPGIRVEGLMTVGPLTGVEKDIRKAFALLFRLREQWQSRYPDINLETLSMGMSGDYRFAIEEGSNMIRPGTLLFGPRPYKMP